MKTTTTVVALLLALILFQTFAQAQKPDTAGSKAAKQPNILFIAIDDLRPELGCYGSEIAISPNLDALAKDGLLFNRAYCQQAICSPSRASLMTGARPDTIGVIENSTNFRVANPDIVTLSQHFIANGYEAVQCGKIFHKPAFSDPENSWSREPSTESLDLPAPTAYALPESRAIRASNNQRLEAKYGKGIARTGIVNGPAYEAADVPDQTYRDGYNTDLAIATMKEIVAKGKPFFLGLGFYKPHLNFNAPKRYWDLYNRDEIPLATQTEAPKDGAEMGLHASFELRVRDGIPKAGPIGPELARTLKHGYLACVSYVDAQIGRMIEALEEAGLRENTIIIVWGDHGWHLGDMGVWGKATNYEIATRVPMMIWTPDMPAGSRGKTTDALVELVDIYPSLCDLAGLSQPAHLEGTSFKPLLEAPNRKWASAAFSQFPSPALREWAANPLHPSMRETFFGPLMEEVEDRIIEQQQGKWDRDLFENHLMGYTMRTNRYRLVVWKDVRNPQSDPIDVELYDHQKDPNETTNIAKRRPKLVSKLLKQFDAGWKGNQPTAAIKHRKLKGVVSSDPKPRNANRSLGTQPTNESNQAVAVYPLSDPSNSGQWILNTQVSDEFEAVELDESKWLVQGRGGVYKSKWIGRAPSQFSPDNVRVEDGKLKLQSRWEPDFDFSDKIDKTDPDAGEAGRVYENITTAAVISKTPFRYGYMEVKCKAANSSVTSSFWGTGGRTELDIFEFMGAPSHPEKTYWGNRFRSNIIDWSAEQERASRRKWRSDYALNWSTAGDFHVYGCQWDKNGVQFFADGKQIQSTSKQQLGDDWILTKPLSIWVDSETFPWNGLPTEETLPTDYEIEYIRVWHKEPFFSEAKNVIALEDRARRKWDSPVVADLDQDGHLDLLITDHGHRASVFWNEGGTFSEPQKLVVGDSHGVAIGDFNLDGRTDLIVSLGGGGGKKPRNPVAYEVSADRTIQRTKDFEYFERSRGRAARLVDCDNDGVLDLVLSAFPLKTQAKGANFLYTNDGGGNFEFAAKLPPVRFMSYRVLETDFNNDGDSDLVFYGGAKMLALQGEQGSGFSEAAGTFAKLASTDRASSVSEIDFDNDGDFDLFVTRLDHPFKEQSSYDARNHRFGYYIFAAFRDDVFYQYDLEIDGDFRMENLQLAYPTLDVFVGADCEKLTFDVDQHGGKDFTLKPQQATGWPDELVDNGLYIGYLGEGVWRVGGKTKSTTSGLVHNVKSKPPVTEPAMMPAVMFENRDGIFVDVTDQLGISIPEQAANTVVGDFDNNGWSDLFVIPDGDRSKRNHPIMYLNQDGRSFVRSDSHGVFSRDLGSTGGGGETFDYDEDGDLDLIYANERGRWYLFTNNLVTDQDHRYVTVKVGTSPSGKAPAKGAVLTLKAGGNIYRRVVGAGAASYSHGANNHLHVGLGTCDKVDKATVRWSNGETQTLDIESVNQAVAAGSKTKSS